MTTPLLLVALAQQADRTLPRAGSSVESSTDFFTLFLASLPPVQGAEEEGRPETALAAAEPSEGDAPAPGQGEIGLSFFPLPPGRIDNGLDPTPDSVPATSPDTRRSANLLPAEKIGAVAQGENPPLSPWDFVHSLSRDLLSAQEHPVSLPDAPAPSTNTPGERIPLPVLPHLQGQHTTTDSADPTLLSQSKDQLLINQELTFIRSPAGTAAIPDLAREEKLVFSSTPLELQTTASPSSPVSSFLRPYERATQKGMVQGSGGVLPQVEGDKRIMDGARLPMLERNWKAEDRLFSPLDKKPALPEKSDTLLAFSPALAAAKQLVPGAGIQVVAGTAMSSRAIGGWQAVIAQVAGELSAHISRSTREAVIHLDPPELGRVKIDLVLEGERVQAHIVAESADVGALIQSHLSELKQALHSHNLALDKVQVDVHTGGQPGSFAQSFQQDARAREGREGTTPFAQRAEQEREESGWRSVLDSGGGVNVWA